jgi:hypothetical protein
VCVCVCVCVSPQYKKQRDGCYDDLVTYFVISWLTHMVI